MAVSKAGERLTDEEVKEFVSYGNQRLPLPEKFYGVVLDNSTPGEMFYRWPTTEETRASADAEKARQAAATEETKIRETAQREAAKIETTAPPPPPPPED